MGIKDVRKAFNEVASPTANCVKALMDTVDGGSQILYFSGNYANGAGFVLQSPPVPPGADVNEAARATARAMLEEDKNA